MRNLQTRDLFNAVRVIKEIGLREEIKKVSLKANKINGKISDNENKEDVGFDLLFTLIEKATEKKAEQKIYEFLASPFECTSKEIEEMDPIELLDKITQVANIQRWKNFLLKAAQFIK